MGDERWVDGGARAEMGGIGIGVESGWIKLYNRRRHLESMIEFIEDVTFLFGCSLVSRYVTD